MDDVFKVWLLATLATTVPAVGQQQEEQTQVGTTELSTSTEVVGPADRIIATLDDPQLRALVGEALARNPRIAAARASAGTAPSIP